MPPVKWHEVGLWVLRLWLGWSLLSTLAAPSARAVLSPVPPLHTHQPQLCVHTRLIDEVQAWKIQKSLAMVREMGATTIVEFFPWAYIEAQRGVYQWTQADTIMRHAQHQGLRVIARLGMVPAWARPDQTDSWTTLNHLPETSFSDFARFAADFAARYAGIADHLIIWNEPNLSFEWGFRTVDAHAYTRLLQSVYTPIKTANPNAIILAGALAPTLEPLDSPHGLNDLLYLEQMLEADAANYFDVLAVHTYGFIHPMHAEPSPSALNFRRIELLRDLMNRYDADTPLIITETGWNDHPRWTQAVRSSQRIAYTLQALDYAAQQRDWLPTLCLWAFRYPAPPHTNPQ